MKNEIGKILNTHRGVSTYSDWLDLSSGRAGEGLRIVSSHHNYAVTGHFNSGQFDRLKLMHAQLLLIA